MQRSTFQTLYSHRELLFAWAFRIIRARYQQSVLGGLWAVLQPLAQVLVFTVIFTQFVPIRTGDTTYILFSATAMIPWTFFLTSVTDMVNSLIDNMSLVTKIYFPREILPLAALLARFVDFLIASLMLVILMLYYAFFGENAPEPLFPAVFVFVPLILLVQIALALGLGLLGAALNVFYRDIRHVFALGLQIWFYASPVIYPIETVPERFRSLYMLNPMVGILSSYRDVVLYGQAPGQALLLAALISALVLLAGYWFFKRVEFQFADVV